MAAEREAGFTTFFVPPAYMCAQGWCVPIPILYIYARVGIFSFVSFGVRLSGEYFELAEYFLERSYTPIHLVLRVRCH